MANSAVPDQLLKKPTDLDLHCLQRHGISGFSRTRVKTENKITVLVLCTPPDDALYLLHVSSEYLNP